MSGLVKQLALRKWNSELRYWVWGWMIGSLICIVVQPFGAESLGFALSILYWFFINGVATALMFGVLKVFGGPDRSRYLLDAVIGSFVFSVIFTPILILINDAVFDIQIGYGFFITNFVVALLVFGIVWAAIDWRTPTQVANVPKFENRLDKYPTAQLWAISAQDHYLEVVTSEGTEMILMRLGDAITELDGRDGIQIHRSHWVARSGIAKNTATHVVLHNEVTLPISRKNHASVKAFFA